MSRVESVCAQARACVCEVLCGYVWKATCASQSNAALRNKATKEKAYSPLTVVGGAVELRPEVYGNETVNAINETGLQLTEPGLTKPRDGNPKCGREGNECVRLRHEGPKHGPISCGTQSRRGTWLERPASAVQGVVRHDTKPRNNSCSQVQCGGERREVAGRAPKARSLTAGVAAVGDGELAPPG